MAESDTAQLRADTALLRASGLTVAHGGRTVLTEVSLRIEPGQRWFIAGPNGAGKSTLLRALLGRHPPATGQVAWGAALAGGRRLGAVLQHVTVPPVVPTTVGEFAALGLVGLRLARGERTRRLSAALAVVGLTAQRHQALATCSGGQRQRAAMARALVREPLLLLCDEPTASLDPTARDRVLAALRRVPTLVVVTHDLALATAHATHVALVAHGTMRSGPTADLLTPAQLAWAFNPVDAGSTP